MKVIAFSLAALLAVLLSTAAHADLLLGPSFITPTTNISAGGFGSIYEIADGIGLETDGPPYNGYGPDAKSGIITLTLNGPYRIFSFLIANDINVQTEGVKDFQLRFYDAANTLLHTTGTLTANDETIPAQTFTVGGAEGINNVSRVEFEVFNVYELNPNPAVWRIEVREVAFNGTAVPEPTTTLLLLSASLVLVALSRRQRRTESV